MQTYAYEYNQVDFIDYNHNYFFYLNKRCSITFSLFTRFHIFS